MTEKMTMSCGNVFEDLGFPPDEAAAMLARATLLIEFEKALKARGKKQQELADELDTTVKPDPEMIDDENPEWTEEDFKKAIPFSELPEKLQKTLRSIRNSKGK